MAHPDGLMVNYCSCVQDMTTGYVRTAISDGTNPRFLNRIFWSLHNELVDRRGVR